jgi:hypothetical protein
MKEQEDYRHDLVVRIQALMVLIADMQIRTLDLLKNGCFGEVDYWDEIIKDRIAEFESLVLIKEALYN